jgi:hypothetical protein
MLLDDAVAEAMEPLLPHEIAERELEMQEVAEIEERRDEELRVAKEEVERHLSIEELAVEYQRELWRRHYYEYYNLEGGAEDEDDDTVDFSWGTRSPPAAACRQDKSSTSHLTPARNRAARRRLCLHYA